MQREYQPTSEEVAWAAGLFEGEGCITFRGKTAASLTLSMIDEDTVVSFQLIVGGLPIRSRIPTGDTKPTYVWTAYNRDEVIRILRLLLPWLHARRREKAELTLERLANNPGAPAARKRCAQGHYFGGGNLYIKANGKRECRTCHREREARRRRRIAV